MNTNLNGFRYPGEFENQKAVILCWPENKYPVKGYDAHEVFTEIIKNLIDEVEVYVNCGFKGVLMKCKETLEKAGIDMSKIHFTEIPDTYSWARDYGPDILTDDKGNIKLVDFRFDGYGYFEENSSHTIESAKFASRMAAELGCKDIIKADIISEGGDKELNGRGILITTQDTEVTKRNPSFTKKEVEDELKRVFNLEKVIWIPYASFEDEIIYEGALDIVNGEPVYRSSSANGHIDEMCRFVGENTILLAEVSEEEAKSLSSAKINKERFDQAYEVLKNETDVNGNPFRIIRIPSPEPIYVETEPGDPIYWNEPLKDGTKMPEGRIIVQPAMSYCNFLIVNNIVLAQCYWQEGMYQKIKEKDEAAKKILESIFPDRKVITINALAVNLMGGGIHCITKNIANSII